MKAVLKNEKLYNIGFNRTLIVDLNNIRDFLEFNGFSNARKHDCEHKQLGLILEDMHDEEVIVNSETLFFTDTVFYTVTPSSI